MDAGQLHTEERVDLARRETLAGVAAVYTKASVELLKAGQSGMQGAYVVGEPARCRLSVMPTLGTMLHGTVDGCWIR